MPLQSVLRIKFMQQWYAMSDPTMEDALYEIESMRCSARLELIGDAIPDESTITTMPNHNHRVCGRHYTSCVER